MIQKLRMKLIWISMGSLVLVIVLLMGLLNLLNYHHMVSGADGLLELLAENDGSFPEPGRRPGHLRNEPPEILDRAILSPETPYETRFFRAHLSVEGELLSVDTGKVAAVDETAAGAYALDVFQKGKERGYAGRYRYYQSEDEEGYLLIFLDCSRQLDACRNVLLTSTGVSVFGILLVFGLIFVFSGMVMRPAYESYEKQKRFITDAGHEIKTPLTIIDADIDVLSMDIGENEWIEDMRRQTERLSGLTNELIYLARMEEGHPQIRMIDLPFSDLTEEKAQSFQSRAIVENKLFSVDIQPMIMLHGDEEALRKLISILLDNAFKYSEKDGSVSLSLEKTGHMVRLTVWNTVDEISKESIEHMFERFYRGDPSRNSQKGGYGIGLSVAEAIVQVHKGEIRAAAGDGPSLTVTVLLPTP